MSLKLNNIDEKKRLSRIVREILPKDTGAIVRTEAKWKTQIELQADMQELLKSGKDKRKH